ncbi:ABC transporter substrate-binding protein [Herbiconiux sp. KACC 21604]|uniref:ABC transporter substrate-binding protein n=1 Tax=unclassified Herbiconiux TaxID=2618217 RepID=UPI0014921395|nr:ABC transporter substrate-binding protein [Herbiconiux sp. SALV-R1]QJU52228.1 ABC transporter substrate-binding protein [Herbiconiux sp. SALV-R1]WPO87073.1 ABC transporter substrate-binding protein [Herbiconiux sp. KACC 21604]
MMQRRRDRRIAVGLALTAAAAITLTACSGSGSGASTPAADAELEGRGPIQYVSSPDASGAAQATIDAWNAEHPDEQVTWVELPLDADQQRQQMVQNAQVEGDAYSVLNLDVVWTSEFAANRWITALPEDTLPVDELVPATVEAASYRDTLYGAPYYTDGALLYSRTDLLTAAGITEAPTTWAEMQEDCASVLALPEAAGMSCYAGQFDKNEGLTVNFSEAVASAGGELFDADGNPTVDTPEAKTALEFLVDGFESGMIPRDAITFQEEQGRQAFQEGKLVFLRNWPYIYKSLSATDGSSSVAGKFGVSAIPGEDGPGVSTLGGRNIAISSFAENKATALDFIAFFTNREQEEARLALSSRAPVFPEFFEDEAVTANYPYLPTLLTSLENAQPRPKVVAYGATTAAIQDEIYAALTGEKTPDAALADLQTKLTDVTKG